MKKQWLYGAGTLVALATSIVVLLRKARPPSPFVSRIRVYPVKGMQGFDVTSAVVTRSGIVHDREWIVIKLSDNTVCSCNWLPKLATAKATIDEANNRLVLSTPDHDARVSLSMDLASVTNAERRIIDNFGISGEVFVEPSSEVQRWIRDLLGTDDVALCRIAAPRDATESKSHAGTNRAGDSILGHDYASLSVICVDGVRWLNDNVPRTARRVTPEQFRPNIIADAVRFPDEDTWAVLKIGAIETVRVAKQAGRCVIPTTGVDGRRDPLYEPTATLRRLRRAFHRHQLRRPANERSPCFMFGLDLFPDLDHPTVIHVGDAITVLERQEPPQYL